MGSLLLPLVVIPLMMGIGFLLRSCGNFSPSCSRVGERIIATLRWNGIITTIKESYSWAILSTFISLRALRWDSNGGIINSVAACFVLAYLIVLTIAATLFLRMKHGILHKEESKERFGALYQDLAVKKLIPFKDFIVFPVFFLVRRVVLAATVVFFGDNRTFQLLLLLWQSLATLAI